MLILALDSAGMGCGAAVWRDGRVLASHYENMERGQDQRLMPLVLGVMKKADVDFDALDRIAATRGPGSFTGIRIGLAAARGIGLASGKPVIGIDRFSIFRAQIKTPGKNLLVAINARRRELFCRFYPASGTPAEPVMMTPDEIEVFLKDKADTIITGDIAFQDAFTKPVEAEVITCAALAALIDVNDPAVLPRPLYIRAPDVTIKKMTYVVRNVEVGDAALLAELHLESFGTAGWNEAQMKGSLDLPTTRGWAAYAGQAMAGFILCQIMPDQSEVLTFCVRPPYRRQGIGEMLLKKAIVGIPSSLLLEAASDNLAALALYEKLGFAVTGKRANYYKTETGAVDAALYTRKQAF